MTKNRTILRYVIILTGLCLCGLGTNFTLLAGLGTDPWSVFHVGLTNYVPLTVGQVTQLVGIIIILLSYPLGIKAQIGTFLNMFFFGFSMICGTSWPSSRSLLPFFPSSFIWPSEW